MLEVFTDSQSVRLLSSFEVWVNWRSIIECASCVCYYFIEESKDNDNKIHGLISTNKIELQVAC
jgi:hypothetical protein